MPEPAATPNGADRAVGAPQLWQQLMKFDEIDLIEFFGVAPVEEDPEEKEFFNSSHFILVDGELTLNISFSTHSPMVMFDLFISDKEKPFLRAEVCSAECTRIEVSPRRLVVLGRMENEQGSDPKLTERLSISLSPLTVDIFK